MKKLNKIFVIFILMIPFTFSCKKNIVQKEKKNISDYELVFAKKMILNKNIETFLDEYFNDSILSSKMHYYFLVVNQEQDSSIVIITPIAIDLGIKEVKPNSFVKYKNKIIFISSVIDRIVDVDNNFLDDFYKQSFKKASEEYRNCRYFKRWVLVINNYNNDSRLIKETDKVMQKLSHPIIEKDTIIEDKSR